MQIQAGKTAPCEVVDGETVLFQGTHTACQRFIDEQRGAQLHISEQVAELLKNDGWQETAPGNFRCMITGFAPAGTISDGTRLVHLTICERGRYLSRVDGWGHVEKDVDLRDFANRPADAIAAVLGE